METRICTDEETVKAYRVAEMVNREVFGIAATHGVPEASELYRPDGIIGLDSEGNEWFGVYDSTSFPYRAWVRIDEDGEVQVSEDPDGDPDWEDPRIAVAEWQRGL